MRRVECLAGFQFHGDRVLNHQVGDVFPNHNTVAVNGDTLLMCNREPSRTDFIRQGVLTHLFQ